MHEAFVEPERAQADLVLHNGTGSWSGLDTLLARVRHELALRLADSAG
jgi:hypothetical protein